MAFILVPAFVYLLYFIIIYGLLCSHYFSFIYSQFSIVLLNSFFQNIIHSFAEQLRIWRFEFSLEISWRLAIGNRESILIWRALSSIALDVTVIQFIESYLNFRHIVASSSMTFLSLLIKVWKIFTKIDLKHRAVQRWRWILRSPSNGLC